MLSYFVPLESEVTCHYTPLALTSIATFTHQELFPNFIRMFSESQDQLQVINFCLACFYGILTRTFYGGIYRGLSHSLYHEVSHKFRCSCFRIHFNALCFIFQLLAAIYAINTEHKLFYFSGFQQPDGREGKFRQNVRSKLLYVQA